MHPYKQMRKKSGLVAKQDKRNHKADELRGLVALRGVPN